MPPAGGRPAARPQATPPEQLVHPALHLGVPAPECLPPRVTREILARSVSASGRDARVAELRGAFRRLTDREREVCALVADGLSNAEIAERLVVQSASAKRAVTRILAKLGLRDRTQIAVRWCRAGL